MSWDLAAPNCEWCWQSEWCWQNLQTLIPGEMTFGAHYSEISCSLRELL